MQRSPIGTPSKVRLKTVIKVLFIAGVIGVAIYMIDLYFGSYFAWAFVFFITLNLYLYYRMSIKGLFSTNEHQTVDQYLEKRGVDNSNEEGYSSYIDRMDQKYQTCPSCSASVIPELDYCEDCGATIRQE